MGVKVLLTDEVIATYKEQLYKQERDRYPARFPDEIANELAEKVRAAFVLQKWQQTNSGVPIAAFLKAYQLYDRVIEATVHKFCDGTDEVTVKIEPKLKLVDKYRLLDQWAFDHPGEQTSPDLLVEVSGLSRPSVVKYLVDTQRYRKIKRGVFEAFLDQQKVI